MIHYLQDMFQMTAIALVSVINYHINGLHLFWDTLYSLTNSLRDKRVHIFPKGIKQKVNVVARQEFELAYYDVAVKHISHLPIANLPTEFWFLKKCLILTVIF